MTKRALPALLILPLLASCATGPTNGGDAPPADTAEVHWTYDGDTGQDAWGGLSDDFAACSSGNAQSPIDLPAHAAETTPEHLRVTAEPTEAESVDTGHTVQLVPEGAGSAVEWEGLDHDLAQVHFHAPSEHTVDGEALAAEFHLVHTTAAGDTLVVGVLAQEGPEQNAAWQPFVEGAEAPGTDGLALDVEAMLPADPTFETYLGSLTTPPCTEGVRWVVYTTPVELSADQLAVLEEASHGHNARTTQPEGDRHPAGGTVVLAH
ncbi:carbonic anhydrase [Promicromonospora thailandica]|uniref:carbonic anhydrase n=1 Tax=Promicromonospora thailandica TaxID=765201 RepID=A0A9X2G0C1_9MICO|nr:carbonic anhydrase family protein [Promicromonospora thailandica]MCP2264700.1 carbonic anhydrase [Promicromonospora thailandica]